MSWLGSLVELLGTVGHAAGLVPPKDDSTSKRERKRRRDYEEWQKKHGSKWDKDV